MELAGDWRPAGRQALPGHGGHDRHPLHRRPHRHRCCPALHPALKVCTLADVGLCAGFGNHLARPLFREKHRPDMSEAEAEALLKEGLQVHTTGAAAGVRADAALLARQL